MEQSFHSVLIFWTPLLKLGYNPIRAGGKYVEQYMKSKQITEELIHKFDLDIILNSIPGSPRRA